MHKDYIKTFPLDINLQDIRLSCNDLNHYIKQNLTQAGAAITTGPLTTQVFNHYNLLLFPYAGFHKLYQEICRAFSSVCDNDSSYYIQCWLNYYNQGQFIDWHQHWGVQDNTYHGFVCIDCEESKTSYKFSNGFEIDIPSVDGTMVIGKSEGDAHRTYPWPHADRPRITIAFDCVPWDKIQWGVNHWVPIIK